MSQEASDLWRLYWGAVVLVVIGIVALSLSVRGPTGLSLGIAALLVGLVLLYALVPPVLAWLIRRIPWRRVRIILWIALPMVFVLAREGFLGDRLAFDFSAAQNANRTALSFTDDVRAAPTKRAAASLACVPYGPEGDIGQGFREAAERLGCVGAVHATARVELRLEATDSFCYLPLYKSAQVPVRGRVSLLPGPGEPESTTDVTGRVERRAVGFESCRAFNRALGAVLAERMMERYHALLSAQFAGSTSARDGGSSSSSTARPDHRPRSTTRR